MPIASCWCVLWMTSILADLDTEFPPLRLQRLELFARRSGCHNGEVKMPLISLCTQCRLGVVFVRVQARRRDSGGILAHPKGRRSCIMSMHHLTQTQPFICKNDIQPTCAFSRGRIFRPCLDAPPHPLIPSSNLRLQISQSSRPAHLGQMTLLRTRGHVCAARCLPVGSLSDLLQSRFEMSRRVRRSRQRGLGSEGFPKACGFRIKCLWRCWGNMGNFEFVVNILCFVARFDCPSNSNRKHG